MSRMVIVDVAFAGLARELIAFLANNAKACFDDNRKTCERVLLELARRFVAAMPPALATLAPDLRAEPRVGSSILGIARDTRFRQAKTPYKTA